MTNFEILNADTITVPGRLSAGELRAMALRQQQQIDSQHQLLAAKEQRLRFLKAQEARGAVAAKEGERLRRLRERVEAQENKLRRLRALRGQVDLQKSYNVTLSSDLESIRALFSEKEKELSVAVAKVEALTRQLEELRRGRRGPPTCREQPPSPAARELDKLRRELMYRNQLSLQQDARLHLQREALQVRQQELRSVDQRIQELQGRLHRKRASNMHLQSQTQTRPPGVYPPTRGNVAAIEPYNHTPQKSTSIVQQPLQAHEKQISGESNSDDQKLKQLQPSLNKEENDNEFYLAEFSANKSDPKYQTLPYNTKFMVNFVKNKPNDILEPEKIDLESNNNKNVQHMTVHSTPLNIVNKSVALAINQIEDKHEIKDLPKIPTNSVTRPLAPLKSVPSTGGNWKPVSSVAPTSIQTKITKVNAVIPNLLLTSSEAEREKDRDKNKPALPPKPPKPTPEPEVSESPPPIPTDNLPIKAKPLTIKKQPLSEQPKLRTINSQSKLNTVHFTSNRRIEMPPAFLFPEIETSDLVGDKNSNTKPADEVDRAATNEIASSDAEVSSSNTDLSPNDNSTEVTLRSKKGNLRDSGPLAKAKLARRVSFDPLALLLDASLEGELELVKKTATQVTNPSAANDEGITALHNAICAGHLEIVKFLVEFGCDVNAQDSDGWTPLHCAASCNNLGMVRFLVERGACLFAATLSDHETPAEKCEEDEEGFDGCSEYLYSVQEKLGILHNGEVFAVFPYEAGQADELSFTMNERITVLRKGDEAEREWWWAKGESGTEGYVPRNLLGLYPRVTNSLAQE